MSGIGLFLPTRTTTLKLSSESHSFLPAQESDHSASMTISTVSKENSPYHIDKRLESATCHLENLTGESELMSLEIESEEKER